MPYYISGEPYAVQVLIENLLNDRRFLIKRINDKPKPPIQPQAKNFDSKVFTNEYRIWFQKDNQEPKPTAITFKITYNTNFGRNWADIKIAGFKLDDLKFFQKTVGVRNEGTEISKPNND